MIDDPIPTRTATQAQQGIKTGRLRWILGVSLALAVVAMLAAAYFA